MKTNELANDTVKQTVRQRYGKIAEHDGGCGCAPTCCQPREDSVSSSQNASDIARTLGYSSLQIAAAPPDANLGLGCGNPQAIASLRRGETVLDLGCGAGFDVFLAARAIGPAGKAIGVDMTPEMISKARANAVRADSTNVEFRLGEIENLPVADASVDVIISNCVINLSPDKPRAFREAFRALKPGGRLAIADVVALVPIPDELRQDWELYTGCVAGASRVDAIRSMLESAGFANIRIAPRPESREFMAACFPERGLEEFVASANIEAEKPAATR